MFIFIFITDIFAECILDNFIKYQRGGDTWQVTAKVAQLRIFSQNIKHRLFHT